MGEPRSVASAFASAQCVLLSPLTCRPFHAPAPAVPSLSSATKSCTSLAALSQTPRTMPMCARGTTLGAQLSSTSDAAEKKGARARSRSSARIESESLASFSTALGGRAEGRAVLSRAVRVRCRQREARVATCCEVQKGPRVTQCASSDMRHRAWYSRISALLRTAHRHRPSLASPPLPCPSPDGQLPLHPHPCAEPLHGVLHRRAVLAPQLLPHLPQLLPQRRP